MELVQGFIKFDNSCKLKLKQTKCRQKRKGKRKKTHGKTNLAPDIVWFLKNLIGNNVFAFEMLPRVDATYDCNQKQKNIAIKFQV